MFCSLPLPILVDGEASQLLWNVSLFSSAELSQTGVAVPTDVECVLTRLATVLRNVCME